MEWKKWFKERNWYFWFVTILVIIAIVILFMDIGDHPMGDLTYLEEYLSEEDENEDEVCLIEETKKPQENKKIKWKREEKCREILESIYNDSFSSSRPFFLKNPSTGKNLELDGYNEKLKVAFEHNGKHHYHYPNTFHKTKQEFLDQLSRDRLKRKLCDQKGVYLITIPYDVKENSLREYIISKLPRE